MRIVLHFSLVAIAILSGPLTVPAHSGDRHRKDPPKQSYCISCHTDVKGLIRLCWKVEKLRPGPFQSAETSGEG